MKQTLAITVALGLGLANTAAANEDIPDQYPQSPLYAAPVEFIPGVFTSIGQTAPPTYENSGQNNNLSFIITGDGVVVINGGGAYILAKALHDEIKARTDQPVILVIDENGQGHAMLGNSYWAEKGVPIIAHVDAAAEFEERGYNILEGMQRLNREKAEGTFLHGPTETFEKEYILERGDFRIEARYLGPSHSAGDVVVWLPNQSLVIAGDMAFHERMLPIFGDTDTRAWLETWDTEFEALNATYVIPGHGHPTNMEMVRRETKGYLEYLRGQIGAHIEAGGGLDQAYYVDQTPYAYLDTFDELATKNAGRVFEQMEFE
ncbi:MAG: glyoxylase-like metal-dependent hydrolase (beta-lactamase superfamily II) [Halocynthiibacter sp.]|jgi:glyoxylase-like metal-dependent hydrolase (beta-lactamase superfamily II)